MKFVGLSWFLLFFSSVVRMLLGPNGDRGRGRSWTGQGSMTMAALALAALWGVPGGPADGGGDRSAAFMRGSPKWDSNN
jgi:hypothetical protein